jgi:hypothetical protein
MIAFFWNNPGLALLSVLGVIFLVLLPFFVGAWRRSRQEASRKSPRWPDAEIQDDDYENGEERRDRKTLADFYSQRYELSRPGSKAYYRDDKAGLGNHATKSATWRGGAWFILGVPVGVACVALWWNPPSVRWLTFLYEPAQISHPPTTTKSRGEPATTKVQARLPSEQIVSDNEKSRAFPSATLTDDDLTGASDLQSLPSAWGRSYELLQEQLVKQSDLGDPVVTNHVLSLDDSWYQPTGNDPFIVFDTPVIKGIEQGVLGFELRCNGGSNSIPMEVYWHAVDEPFSQERVIQFTAAPGFQLIPMDSRFSWSATKIDQLRIDLKQAAACEKFRVAGIQLFRRKEFD